MNHHEDTIFARASAPGRAGVMVVRISGPQSVTLCQRLTGRTPPSARRATLRHVVARDGEVIDSGLVLYFSAPDSFTGEDVLELHLHGARAVLAEVVALCAEHPGCRAAEPGEFSRRAFYNNKLDLTAAEGIADLVEAETVLQARQALRQMQGAIAQQIATWRTRLIHALALIEAEIDFSAEEGDVPERLAATVSTDLRALHAEITTALAQGGHGERLRAGVQVAILGAPNAGKSTLLNRVAQREVAIVSEIAGTTRDVLEVPLDLNGVPVTLFDTAGLRDSSDPIERIGVERARARAEQADLKLLLFDVNLSVDAATAHWLDDDCLIVLSKADRVDAATLTAHRLAQHPLALALSAQTGFGMDALLVALQRRAEALVAGGSEPVITRARHRRHLQDVLNALQPALDALDEPLGLDVALLAEDLRQAARALGRITGSVDAETVLDEVFATFCIGK